MKFVDPTRSRAQASAAIPGITPPETVRRRDRWLVLGPLALAVILCWAWLVAMARDMYGPMAGASAWMMTDTWDLPHLLLLFAMWVVMMAGMMLPTAAPALLADLAASRRGTGPARAVAHAYAFAAGYLLVWTGFSLVATILQRLLARWLVLSPMMESQSRVLDATLLVLAGVYQLTPFKKGCLGCCRSSGQDLDRNERRGAAGGLCRGVTNGLFCLGCCWALMLLLFVGGVMNLWWIGALALLVLLEKTAPHGIQGGRLAGILIIAWGAWTYLR